MDNQGTPFSENVKQPTIGGFFIILLIGAVIGFQLGRWSNSYERRSNISPTVNIPSEFPTGVACTQDAKVCPDGSSVERVGPNCEFAPCPEYSPPSPAITSVTEGCVTAGCSSELCVDQSQSDMVSPCIYKDEYTCLSYSKCERQSDGNCGWTQTPEYLQCLANLKSSSDLQ